MDRSIPRHAADVKAVGAVAVGPQSHLALGLPHRSGQGEGRAAKVRVLCQVGYTYVLLRQDRAGGDHQRATRPQRLRPGGVVQDRPLHRQGEQVVRLFVPDIRLLPDDAETRAGASTSTTSNRARSGRNVRPSAASAGSARSSRPLLRMRFSLPLSEGHSVLVLIREGGGEGLASRRRAGASSARIPAAPGDFGRAGTGPGTPAGKGASAAAGPRRGPALGIRTPKDGAGQSRRIRPAPPSAPPQQLSADSPE